ncbi:hypothetical protein Tco_1154162 [Tanacetum coccineum]
MEDTMLDLLEICRQKELYCMHNNVEDLIECALNSKLLSINLNSQHLNKEKQEVKNIAEPTAKHQTRITSCLQNFKLFEDLIPIPREFEDSSRSVSESVLPLSDDFSPIFEEKSVTFSNPLFDSNDFTSSDNELLSDEDVSEDVKIYSNPLFEFDDEYISSDVNPLFDEVLENIENMDISTDIENGYHDSEGDIIYLESLLIEDTSPNLPPVVFLDHDPRSLKDEPDNDDLMTEDKVQRIKNNRDSLLRYALAQRYEIQLLLAGVREKLNQQEQATNVSTHTPEPLRRFNIIYYYDDDDEENTIPLNEITSQIPLSIAITPVLPTMDPEDSLIMGDENLSTIPEKELDEVIKSSVENLVPISSESDDTSDNNSEYDLPFYDDSPHLDVLGGNFVTFSNPLFDSNDDFTSSDDESLSDEDIPEDNVKIYSNPLFKLDDEYISSDVNPLFDEVIEDIESKASYDSNLDEPDLLVIPLSIFNEDECFVPGGDVDKIELLLHRDPSTPKISVASILEGFTDEPPLEENDDLFDLESKENEWKKILYDAPIDDLMTEDKVFDPGILEKFFSSTYVRLPFEDRHYLSLTYVI